MQIRVKKAQKGDAEAFVSLIEECKMGMYRVAKGYFQSEDDVADAIADTVLSAWENLSHLRKAAYFRTWLIRILINTCNQMQRERSRLVSEEFLPEDGYLDEEYANIEFREMLSAFPEDCRMIIQLYYGEQFNTREIADILDMNENTVKSKLRRTRIEIREKCICNP
ncbi:MAG: RNA polymerase sigma factor [Lachnospiraceae bacterium]|nr:RNA polymerase sigma factor [Lachnospiraceae bacterium]